MISKNSVFFLMTTLFSFSGVLSITQAECELLPSMFKKLIAEYEEMQDKKVPYYVQLWLGAKAFKKHAERQRSIQESLEREIHECYPCRPEIQNELRELYAQIYKTKDTQ